MHGHNSEHQSHNSDIKLEPIHLLYDERMLLHRPIGWIEPDVFPETSDGCDDKYPMENPERLRVIYERLSGLEERLVYEEDCIDGIRIDGEQTIFKPLRCTMATKEQICLAHSEEQYNRLEEMQYYSNDILAAMSQERIMDIYYCHETFQAAKLAAGGLLVCVDAVCDTGEGHYPLSTTEIKKTNKALALVRPPGHHACQSQEMGFCFIDSVVVAAKYAIATKKAKKVLILDWDIHDGNGTAEETINDENILRIDIHRYNKKEGFYPYTGSPNQVGNGKARGLNVNLAWTHGGMGNTEYAAAIYEFILPLIADYEPDLLLISCGLDAARGDLLGGCNLTPDFFHAMTRATLEVVGPTTPVVCALEGGYTMSVIPECMESVALAMLNCPFRYHSSVQLGSYRGGAASPVDIRSRGGIPWPLESSLLPLTLQRARRVLSKYYIRDGCSSIIHSAIDDINTVIRIFKGIKQWNSVDFHRLRGPAIHLTCPGRAKPPKKRKQKDVDSRFMCNRPIQRPRVFLWYGTELHHQKGMNYQVRTIS